MRKKGDNLVDIYGLKTCDTCRKALKSLPDARFVDARSDGVPDPVLSAAWDRFGAGLLNTRSTTWRGLSDEARTAAPLDLIREHPALMKRPLIVDGDAMYLGWTPDTRAALGVS
jgi:arsenate reductase